MMPHEKPLVWRHGQIKTPPFSREARVEAGYFLGLLQRGEKLSLPYSRPMPTIGRRCHELRVNDREHNWRIVYRLDPDAIVLLEVFSKKTGETPDDVKEKCQQRLKRYDSL